MQIPTPVPWLSLPHGSFVGDAFCWQWPPRTMMCRKLLLLKPDNYENFRAMDFHELSDED